MRSGQNLVSNICVGELRGCAGKYGDTVLPDCRVQLHDLPVGVPVGQNPADDDASSVSEEETVIHATAKFTARVSDKSYGNAFSRVHRVPMSQSAVLRVPSVDGMGQSK